MRKGEAYVESEDDRWEIIDGRRYLYFKDIISGLSRLIPSRQKKQRFVSLRIFHDCEVWNNC